MRHLVIACCLMSAIGCAGRQQILLPDAGAASAAINTLVTAYPLAGCESVRAVLLWRNAAMSCHFVQVRDHETPHIHAAHDLTVTLLRGNGELYLNNTAYPMWTGDSAVVPRGTSHYFVNQGATPAAALVTFAPAYNGADNVPADR